MIQQLTLQPAVAFQEPACRPRWQEINALRQASAREIYNETALSERVSSFFSGLASDLFFCFAPRFRRSTICRIYGHVHRARRWSGNYPTCNDCGARITAPDQLRVCDPRPGTAREPVFEQVYKSRIEW